MMLRISSAVGGTVMPSASSTARTLVSACTVVQTPQTRSVMAQASRGIAADEDLFQAAHHGACAECVGDDAVFHHCLNAQVAFNTSDRIDDYACHRLFTTPSGLQRGLPQ